MQATFTRKKGTTKDGRDYDFISGRTIPENTEFTISKKAFPELPEEVKKLLEELPAGGLAAVNLPEDFYIFTPEDEEGKKYPRRYLCKKKGAVTQTYARRAPTAAARVQPFKQGRAVTPQAGGTLAAE